MAGAGVRLGILGILGTCGWAACRIQRADGSTVYRLTEQAQPNIRNSGRTVTNTSLLGSAHVLAVRPWHTGCLLYLATPSSFLPSLDLLS